MKRIVLIAAILVCAAAVTIAGTGAGEDDSGTYRVRAIFDSAFSLIEGEDVKVAGVKVGKIEELAVTDDKKAAVVMRIDQPGFGNFRKDATCIIRPQSLIGEKYVECDPTKPRPDGDPLPPLLPEIPEGEEGAGQHLVPVQNTARPVDIDLVNNILRLPFRQRLSLLINELGTGLAGRGKDLNQVIRRANPALMETGEVLKIIARQNQVLADLARDSDTVLAPLADKRQNVANFIEQANTTAQATAERRGDLERNFQRLPTFLRELRPTLDRLGDLSDEMSPVLEDLSAQAPNINRFVMALGPFSQASRPAFDSLGEAAKVGTRSVVKIRPLTRDVRSLARVARPTADDLEAILTSFKDTGGIERLMDYLFFQVAAVNGFDSTGHYLRAALLVNLCSTYSVEQQEGCQATFTNRAGGAEARISDDPGRAIGLRRQDAILRGESLKSVMKRLPDPKAGGKAGTAGKAGSAPAATTKRAGASRPSARPLRLPRSVLPGIGAEQGKATIPTAPKNGTTIEAPAPDPAKQSQSQLLDYLLGGSE